VIDALPDQPPPVDRAVVLLAHGSADPRSPAAVNLLAQRLAVRTGFLIIPAFLDHVPPLLPDAVGQLVEQGVVDITVLPLLLSTAFHVTVDVPEAIANAKQSDCRIVQLAAIGHPGRVLAALLPNGPTPTVVVSAGTSVQAEREAFMNAINDAAMATGRRAVAAFASGAGPTVADAVAALREQSNQPINVLPWLLAPGVFTDRVAEQAAAATATYVPLPGGLIAQPVLVEELERRINDAMGLT
jgi:sirohydrochlorin ferrochelatase